jgi:hypothetical protein
MGELTRFIQDTFRGPASVCSDSQDRPTTALTATRARAHTHAHTHTGLANGGSDCLEQQGMNATELESYENATLVEISEVSFL